ncbi:MAG: T9SS type A sorting domain-containing protein, partial [Saprospiraceae bacterium]
GYTERYACGEVLEKKYYSCLVSNSENSLSTEFSLYPNPASDVLYLKLSKEDYANTEYKIIDLFGRINSVSNLNESGSIDISELSIGNYFLLIKQKERTRVLRFCKAN